MINGNPVPSGGDRSTDDFLDFPTGWRRALCVVAHPDDLEYGPSSAIARWTQDGCEVGLVVATRGEAGIQSRPPCEVGPTREREEIAAAAEVGIRDVVFLDHPDGTIQYGLPLRHDIVRQIRRFRPDILVTINFHERWRSGDWNSPDHRALGTALMDAATDAGNRWIFADMEDDGLAPWPGVRFVAVGGSPLSGHAVDVSATMEAGVRALAAHQSYLENLGVDHPMSDARSVLEEKATRFGQRYGGRKAMAFEIIHV